MKFNRDQLFDYYVNQHLSIRALGRLYKCRTKVIKDALKQFGIQLRTITKVEDQEIIKLYEKYKNVKKVSLELNCSISKVYNILHKYGYNFDKKDNIDRNKIIKLYKDGWSSRKISNELGISEYKILKIVKQAGILRKQSQIKYPQLQNKQYLLSLVKSGKTIREICNIIGCGRGTLQSALRRFKIRYSEDHRKRSSKPINANQDILNNKESLKEYVKKFPTLAELSRQLSRHTNTIKRYLIKHDLMYIIENHKKIDISREELYKLYVIDGLSTNKIADKFNCYAQDISKLLKKYNIPLRDRKINKEKILSLINQGVSKNKIISLLNISMTTLNKVLDEYNIKFPNQSNNKLSDENWLREQLSIYSPFELAQKLNVAVGTVNKYINKFKIRNTQLSSNESGTIELRGKLSKLATDVIIDGDISSKQIDYESPKCGKIHLRSSLELKIAKELDNDDGVISYNYENIIIPYDHYNYIVDFEVNAKNGKYLIEAKSSTFLSHLYDEKLPLKIIALDKYCRDNKINGYIYTEDNKFNVREIAASLLNEDLRNLFDNKQQIINYLYNRKFLYPYVPDDKLCKEIDKLINSDIDKLHTSLYTRIHQRFFDNFWSSKKSRLKSMREAFRDKSIIEKAINRIFKDNNSVIETRIIREMERCGASKPSIFKPQIARYIYKRFKPKSILDPCAGWGGRMIGTIGLCKYYGFDINKKMVNGNNNIIKWLKNKDYDIDAHILQGDIFDLNFNEKVDMIFTSPPFGNSEFYDGYFEEYPGQKEYIDVILELGNKYLNKNGIIIIHTNNIKLFEIYYTLSII